MCPTLAGGEASEGGNFMLESPPICDRLAPPRTRRGGVGGARCSGPASRGPANPLRRRWRRAAAARHRAGGRAARPRGPESGLVHQLPRGSRRRWWPRSGAKLSTSGGWGLRGGHRPPQRVPDLRLSTAARRLRDPLRPVSSSGLFARRRPVSWAASELPRR